MLVSKEKNAANAYSRLLNAIGAYGLTAIDTADSEIFREAAEAVPGNPISGDVISACYPEAPAEHRWFCIHDQAGRWISTQAARLDEVDRIRIRDFVVDKACRLYGPDARVRSSQFRRSLNLDSLIGGSSVYLYRMAIAGDRYRDQTLSGLLSVAFKIALHRRWDPDNIFGLVAPRLVESGFAERCGFGNLVYADAPQEPDVYVFDFREDLQTLVNQTCTLA